jgi:hypothetical protein
VGSHRSTSLKSVLSDCQLLKHSVQLSQQKGLHEMNTRAETQLYAVG